MRVMGVQVQVRELRPRCRAPGPGARLESGGWALLSSSCPRPAAAADWARCSIFDIILTADLVEGTLSKERRRRVRREREKEGER